MNPESEENKSLRRYANVMRLNLNDSFHSFLGLLGPQKNIRC